MNVEPAASPSGHLPAIHRAKAGVRGGQTPCSSRHGANQAASEMVHGIEQEDTRSNMEGKRQGASSGSLLAPERRRRKLTVLFGVAISTLILATNSKWASNVPVAEGFFVVGVSLACVGALGRSWSGIYIAGRKTSTLVMEGPYSCCRNPLYLFSAVGMLGIGLATATITIPAIMAFFFAVYYPMIIRCEEQRLAERHGPVFQSYRSVVPAFWPRVSKLHEPDTYAVFPLVVRKHLFDAFWFVALAAVVSAECHLALRYPQFSLMHLW